MALTRAALSPGVLRLLTHERFMLRWFTTDPTVDPNYAMPRPMYVTLILSKLDGGAYHDEATVLADVDLIFDNCIAWNSAVFPLIAHEV
jgi:hypothetical protein